MPSAEFDPPPRIHDLMNIIQERINVQREFLQLEEQSQITGQTDAIALEETQVEFDTQESDTSTEQGIQHILHDTANSNRTIVLSQLQGAPASHPEFNVSTVYDL